MIIIIAGPSGSGKTTFIKYLNLMIKDLEIISVDVVSPSRQYINEVGRNNFSCIISYDI